MESCDGIGGPVDAEFEALALIAKIGGRVQDGLCSFSGECCAGFDFELAEDSDDLWRARARA